MIEFLGGFYFDDFFIDVFFFIDFFSFFGCDVVFYGGVELLGRIWLVEVFVFLIELLLLCFLCIEGFWLLDEFIN